MPSERVTGLSKLLSLDEQSWNAKGPENPDFSPGDFLRVADGLEEGEVPVGNAPSIKAPSSPRLLGTFKAEVLSAPQLSCLLRGSGVMVFWK